jgi:hypothetical protein
MRPGAVLASPAMISDGLATPFVSEPGWMTGIAADRAISLPLIASAAPLGSAYLGQQSHPVLPISSLIAGRMRYFACSLHRRTAPTLLEDRIASCDRATSKKHDEGPPIPPTSCGFHLDQRQSRDARPRSRTIPGAGRNER